MDDAELTSAIRDAILSGEFVAQQRLIESDLSHKYDASRAAVRLALLALAGEGLVERLPNRGARVRAISVEEAIEIVEARVGLEVLCARKAAERLTDAEAEELRRIRADIEAAVAAGDLFGYSRHHQLMDQRIREYSGHATAKAVLERLRAQSARHQFRLSFQAGRAQVSGAEHVAIIDAILAKDPDEAERATRAHLDGVAALLGSLEE